jgi:prophage tail gpP-like protein
MMLEVNGVQYTDFVSANCEIRLDALSNTFNFETVMTDGQALPFKGGDACKVIVDGETVLTGFIEVIDVDYDGESHSVNISGRDKTADLLDSTIDILGDIRGKELSLKVIIENVIAHIGADIKVIDEVGPPLFNGAEDIAAPEPGDNAFSFISKYAEKRQVLLTSNGDGNLVIATNSGIPTDGAIQHIIGAEDNNVMEGRYRYDLTGRYNDYQMSSGLNPVALNNAGETDLASVVDQGGGVFDTEIRKGRRLTLESKTSMSSTECTKRAFWEADIRKARGTVYFAKAPLFRVDGTKGKLWEINRIYQIVDDFIGKVEPMLCNSITFSFDLDGGRVTSLGFVGQNAYTLDLTPDPSAEVADNVA